MGNEWCVMACSRGRKEDKRGKLPIIEMSDLGVRCLIDSGSECSIIAEEALNKFGLDSTGIKRNTGSIVTIVGSQPMLGSVKVSLEGLTGIARKVKMYVVRFDNKRYDLIVGCDVLKMTKGSLRIAGKGWKVRLGRKGYEVRGRAYQGDEVVMGTVVVNNKGGTQEDWAKHKFQDVFYREGETLTATGRATHRIDLINDRPVYVKPRRYPQAMREIIKREIKSMLLQGIIKPSKSEYNSPLWVVPKKVDESGAPQYRVVVDYRELNKVTRSEKYPLPRIEEILDRMGGAKIFSVLDLKSGYHQIRMHPDDSPKTAFMFERGHYEFARMPFGLKNAPATFQKLMDEVLEGVGEDFCQIYMDDIIVFSPDRRTHEIHLTKLFKKLKKFELKVSGKKTRLFCSEVAFMGHTISERGVEPDKAKIEAIRKIPVPRNQKEVRTLLGMAGYYRKFIAGFSQIVEPLTRLLRKSEKFEVTEGVKRAVEEIKKALCSTTVLRFPDFTRPFIITADASGEALGAVLSQKENDDDRPVEYASRKLSETERRYSAIEREFLGVVWAVQHFRPYVFGRHFLLNTDHMPLLWVGKLKETSARVTKWKEQLSAYDFSIRHVKGSENVVADCLSRSVGINALNESVETPGDQQEREPRREEMLEPIVLEEIINNKRRQLIIEPLASGNTNSEFSAYGIIKLVTIKLNMEDLDEDLIKLIRRLTNDNKEYHIFCRNQVIMNRIKQLIISGQLARERFVICTLKVQTIVNKQEQDEIVKSYHIGKTNHRGLWETLKSLKQEYYWINMTKTIRRILDKCEICNKIKYVRKPHQLPYILTDSPGEPLDTVSLDIFHYQKNKFLTAIDLCSRLAFVYRVKTKSATEVIEGVLTLFSLLGIPKTIQLDNGREFKNGAFVRAMKEMGCDLHFVTVGHHKSQGNIERFHSTLIEHIQLIQEERNLAIGEAAVRAALAYNHSIHRGTGLRPLEVFHGNEECNKQAKDVTGKLKRERGRKREIKYPNNICQKLRVGDVVYKKNFYKRLKSDNRYVGPYNIKKILTRHRVIIELAARPGREETIHVEDLRLVNGNEIRKRID